MLVTGLGPHSECTAKLGFGSALLLHHQPHGPGHSEEGSCGHWVLTGASRRVKKEDLADFPHPTLLPVSTT